MNPKSSQKTIIITLCMAMLVVLAGCSTAPVSSPIVKTTLTPTPPAQSLQPIDIITVSGPLQPINPGGPVVEIVLKNVSSEPVTALTATLELSRSFSFSFAVSATGPLLAGQTISAKQTLIGGGFSGGSSYPLTINGSMLNGAAFTYSRQVTITP
jgi:hypothetical protein